MDPGELRCICDSDLTRRRWGKYHAIFFRRLINLLVEMLKLQYTDEQLAPDGVITSYPPLERLLKR